MINYLFSNINKNKSSTKTPSAYLKKNITSNMCITFSASRPSEYDNYKMKDYEGLGLVNISIFPHFDINNENQKQEVKEISKIIP